MGKEFDLYKACDDNKSAVKYHVYGYYNEYKKLGLKEALGWTANYAGAPNIKTLLINELISKLESVEQKEDLKRIRWYDFAKAIIAVILGALLASIPRTTHSNKEVNSKSNQEVQVCDTSRTAIQRNP